MPTSALRFLFYIFHNSLYIGFMALYHKYRPQTLQGLAGQEHIREILINTLESDRVGHGYLLAGPRGLGKTTTARILAKAINCQHKTKKSVPCDNCQSCQEIALSSSLDVIEIDAASNRGIDEIRELRDKVRFAPTVGVKKIYIIDEVHMLTKEAFNALLKTLEEPPSHAVFILATTEAHKIPDTILSRVQRFDFRRPEINDLVSYLKTIAQKENVQIDEPALTQLARMANGSYRDGLVLLDQVAGTNKKINLEWVLESLGLPSLAEADKFIIALWANDLKQALEITDNVAKSGKSISYFIDLIVLELRKQLRLGGDLSLARWIEELLGALEQIKYSPDPIIPLELAIYRMVKSKAPVSQGASSVKKKVQIQVAEPKIHIKLKNSPSQINHSLRQSVKIKLDAGIDIHKHWSAIIREIKKQNVALAGFLQSAKIVDIQAREVKICVKYQFYKDLIEQPRNFRLVEKILLQNLGAQFNLKIIVDPQKILEQEKKQDDELFSRVSEVFDDL